MLARPDQWQPMYTRASMAMGYEIGVTPVQLAAAYGAIANDGVLLAPTLLREVRDPSGTVLFRREPEPVRRVVSPEIAERAARSSCGARSVRGGPAARRSWSTTRCWARPAPPGGSRTAATSPTSTPPRSPRSFPPTIPSSSSSSRSTTPRGATTAGAPRRRSPERCCSRRSPRAGSRSIGAGSRPRRRRTRRSPVAAAAGEPARPSRSWW